jgi:hypothetical protein
MHRHHIAGLGLGLGLLAASGAAAQTVTPTSDINTPVNHPFQQQLSIVCPGNIICQITFPATAAPRTQIQHVSCFTGIKTGSPAPGSAVLSDQTHAGTNYVPVFTYGPNPLSAGTTDYGINADTELFFTKGDVPAVIISASAGTINAFQCTLSGYHTIAGQT